MPTRAGDAVRVTARAPEPAGLWIRYAPRVWPAPGVPWLDLGSGRLEGLEWLGGAEGIDIASQRLPELAGGPFDDLVWLPPVPPALRADRDRLAGRLLAAGTPVLIQALPGETPTAAGATVVIDLTPAVLGWVVSASGGAEPLDERENAAGGAPEPPFGPGGSGSGGAEGGAALDPGVGGEHAPRPAAPLPTGGAPGAEQGAEAIGSGRGAAWPVLDRRVEAEPDASAAGRRRVDGAPLTGESAEAIGPVRRAGGAALDPGVDGEPEAGAAGRLPIARAPGAEESAETIGAVQRGDGAAVVEGVGREPAASAAVRLSTTGGPGAEEAADSFTGRGTGRSPATADPVSDLTLPSAPAAALWPLIAGLTDTPALLAAALDRLAAAGAAAVVPFVPRLDPAARRRLAEAAGGDAFDRLFHGGEPDERAFARAAAARGLGFLLPRPLPRPPLGGAANRRLAAALAAAGELWLRLGRAPSQGQAFFRAARWADETGYDLPALAREGHLGVVEAVDPASRALIEEAAATGGEPALVAELTRAYLAEEERDAD